MVHRTPSGDQRRLHEVEAGPREQQRAMYINDGRSLKSAGGDLGPKSGNKPAERHHDKSAGHPHVKIMAFGS
jgi:hypothetical protein